MTTDWLKDLENMERVVEVFELLGGKTEPRISQLVTPYRRIKLTTDVLLREAPFSSSQKMPHRLFLFRDLIILGRLASPLASVPSTLALSPSSLGGGVASNPPKVKRRSFIASLFSSSPAATPPPLPPASSSSSSSYKEKVKLSHYLPMAQCTVRSIPNEDAGTFGLQLTFVSRISAPLPGSENKTQIVTRVEKLEVWQSSKEAISSLYDTLQGCIEELAEEEASRRDNDAASTMSSATSRSWAKGRPTLMKRSMSKRDSASFEDRSSLSDVSTAQPALSLADLESRYNIDFSSKELPENTMVFSIEFGEGQMGFSLSSGPGVGVLVGKLASGSFAEVGGVTVGDRLASVNGIEIDLDTTWQKAVEIIKAAGRPVVLGFVRNAMVKSKVDEQEKPSDAKRKWATGRAQRSSVRGLVSLVELEKMYASTASNDLEVVPEGEGDASLTNTAGAHKVLEDLTSESTSEEERQCLSILMEILETERSYVTDLRALIKEYVIPLRRATKRRKCKDREDGSLMCEHGSLRTACAKQSSESQSLISADDIRIIFMNTETLVKVNAELLHALHAGLQGLVGQPEPPTLIKACGVFSHAFSKITPFFTMYSLYCHQYSAAVERLHTVRQDDEEVDQFLKQRETRSALTSLRSLLIKPVQRICRYPLLFQELLQGMRKLEKVSAGSMRAFVAELEGTTETVEKIANDVNKKVEDQDSIGQMLPVFHELGGAEGGDSKMASLMAPQRRFVRAEEVCYREAPFDKEAAPIKLYLFNDLVVLAVPRFETSNNGTLRRAKSGMLDRRKSRGRSLSNLLGAREPSVSIDDKQWAMQCVHWIDLSTSTVQAILNPDEAGWSGFQLKSVERQVVDVAKDKKKKTTKDSAGTSRVVTSINKFEIWLENKDKLARLMEDIEEHINRLEIQQSRAERGVRRYGPSDQKKTRSWKAKKTVQDGGTGGDSIDTDVSGQETDETASFRIRRAKSSGLNKVDKTAALSALEKKYNQG